jgi:hypothetical protein
VTFSPIPYYSTQAQRVKIKAAEKVLNETIHSKCFADFMTSRKLIQTQGKTPTQVVAHLQGLSGDVPVKMYYSRFSSAVAYRQPPSMVINLNTRNFYPTLSNCEWAATMAHESLGHSLGSYEHDYKWNKARSFSVPYSIGGGDTVSGGDAFQKCCKEM